jgi:hypothetical protein
MSLPNREPAYQTDPDITQVNLTRTSPMFNEAPSVIFGQLYGLKNGQVVQFNLTVRSNSAQEAIDQFLQAVQYAGEKYKLSTVRPDVGVAAPTNKPAAPAAQPAPASSSPSPSLPSAPVAPVAPAPSAAQNVIYASKLKVTPMEDDKVRLEWMSSGHEFADISKVCLSDKALDLLASTGPWEYAHIAKIKIYNVNHKITWVQGKPNNKNGFYKDIVSVTPSA